MATKDKITKEAYQEVADKACLVLKEVADFLITMDTEEIDGVPKSYYMDFSDDVVMDVTHIFSCIIGNRLNKSDKASEEMAQEFGEMIHLIVKKYAGVDTKKFYNDKK